MENQVTALSDNPNAIFSIDGDFDVDVLVTSSSYDKIALYETRTTTSKQLKWFILLSELVYYLNYDVSQTIMRQYTSEN